MYILFVDSCFQGTQQAYSNPNLSQTAQNPARFFENNIFAHLLIAQCAWLYAKKCKALSTHQKSRHFKERGKTNLQCPMCGHKRPPQ